MDNMFANLHKLAELSKQKKDEKALASKSVVIETKIPLKTISPDISKLELELSSLRISHNALVENFSKLENKVALLVEEFEIIANSDNTVEL